MNNDSTLTEIIDLERMAESILKKRNELRKRRPIVIEFCGSPKSGKTSCINSLKLFLKRNDFKVGVVTEQASICPIADKHNPSFNTWTVNSTISELNALLDPKRETMCDIIICDRAIFDALCWFEWLYKKKALDINEYSAITDYISLARWSNKIDLVCIFKATPQTSIEREYAHLLTRKPGSIMNIKTLSEYINCIEVVKARYENRFRLMQEFDTSTMGQNEVSAAVTKKVLEELDNILEEKVGYIQKNTIKNYGLDCDQPHKSIIRSLDIQVKDIEFHIRKQVEDKADLLQIIPIGVITNPEHDKVLILKKQKSASSGSPERNSYMIWAGGHMREEDKIKDLNDFVSLAKITLKREIEEELGVSISLDDINPYYIYTTDHPNSKQHLAICFLIEIDIDGLQLSIDSYELVQKRGTSKSGTFVSIHNFENPNYAPIESWTRLILKEIFNIIAPEPTDAEQLFWDID